jgi:hypothetical protein
MGYVDRIICRLVVDRCDGCCLAMCCVCLSTEAKIVWQCVQG